MTLTKRAGAFIKITRIPYNRVLHDTSPPVNPDTWADFRQGPYALLVTGYPLLFQEHGRI